MAYDKFKQYNVSVSMTLSTCPSMALSSCPSMTLHTDYFLSSNIVCFSRGIRIIAIESIRKIPTV